MKLLLPILLAVLGVGAGVGAGLMLRPAPEPMKPEMAEGGETMEGEAGEKMAEDPDEARTDTEFVEMANQFVVPIMEGEAVAAMVVMSISVEVDLGTTEAVYAREPRLRDAILQVLFDHSNAGGFDGNFVQRTGLESLRGALRETARKTVGDNVADILITDLLKRDV